jgi:hypothetical protein
MSSKVKFYNNISWARFSSDAAYQVYGCKKAQQCREITAKSNLVAKGKISKQFRGSKFLRQDPVFVDKNSFDFHTKRLMSGTWHKDMPLYDIEGTAYPNPPSLGAYATSA